MKPVLVHIYELCIDLYQGHETFNKFKIDEREKKLFSLCGAGKSESRARLYKFMLENMNDEDRFKTTYNICNDVLKGVAEGNVRLEGRSAFCLLRVSLFSVICWQFKTGILLHLSPRNSGFEPPEGFLGCPSAVHHGSRPLGSQGGQIRGSNPEAR